MRTECRQCFRRRLADTGCRPRHDGRFAREIKKLAKIRHDLNLPLRDW
jgi:hypothetical protein